MNDLELELNIPFINEYCYLGITTDNMGSITPNLAIIKKKLT